MRKFYRLGISMLLLLAAVLPAAYAYNFESGGIYYDITGTSPNTVAVTYATGSYNSYSGNVDIPSTVTYNGTTYTVTAIGNNAFRNCSGLTGVSIPGTVTSIGEYAFCDCSGLTSVTIPESVETINGHAFDNCWGLTMVVFNAVNCSPTAEGHLDNWGRCDYYGRMFCGCNNVTTLIIGDNVQSIPDYAFRDFYSLTTITIPSSVTSIGAGAFKGCSSLTAVNIGNSVSHIGDYAFSNCTGLSSLHIPSSVVSIGTCAISGCTNLSSLTVAISNPVYDSRNNCNSVIHTASNTLVIGCKNSSFPNTINSIGDSAFYDCSSLSGVLTLPNSVKHIGTRSFYGCTGLSSSLIIGDSISVVGYEAFRGCSGLTSLIIGQSVDSIGANAFGYCSNLSAVTFNADSCSCLTNVFDYDTRHRITTLTIGNNVKIIPYGAFYGFNIGSLNIPNSISYIGNNAFSGCSISGMLFLPNSVIYIGDKAFYECVGITGTLTIPNSVTYIGNNAFSSCYGITGTLTIPNSVTYIGNNAFSQCGISSVAFYADSCSSGYRPFQFCGDLETLTIGNTVRIFPNMLFEDCYHLTGELFIPNSVKRIGERAFRNCSGFIGNLNLPNSLTYIGDNAFEGCTGFTGKLVIPDSVVTIGHDAFRYNSGLDTLVVGKAVESIGYAAFNGCSVLSHIIFNADSCVQMSQQFPDCNNLISLTIGDNVKNIPDYAFYGCNNLAGKLVIPDSVITIGKQAFCNCVGFDTLVVGKSVKNIQYYSSGSNISSPFSGCSGLNCLIYNAISCNSFLQYYYVFPSNISSLVIGEKVRSIPDYAFKNLNISGTLIIPDAVVSIGKQAFYGRQIDTLTIGKSVALIDQEAFASCPLNYLAYNADSCSFGGGYNNRPFLSCNGVTTLIIGNNVKYIPAYAFYSFNQVTGTLAIPDSVVTIGNSAFSGCSGITSISFGQSVDSIGASAFYGCSGVSGMIIIPNSVRSIEYNAFSQCSMDSLTVGKKVSYLGKYTFASCPNLKYVAYNADSCTVGGASWETPFDNCSNFTTLTIGNNVKHIPAYIFRDRSTLTGTLIIPDSVISIGTYAFRNCSNITGLVLGRSLVNIGDYGISSCSRLEFITSYAVNAPVVNYLQGHSFYNIRRYIPVYVPCGSTSSYQNAWQDWEYSPSVTYNYFTNIQETLSPYLLTVSSADTAKGTVQVVSQASCTDPAVIKATPKFFYVFSHWSDGNTDNPRTIMPTQDTMLVAHFRECTLTILPPSDTALGQILVLQEPTVENPQAIIQVTPNSCYAFYGWVSPANNWGTISYDNPYTLTLYQDTVIRASFYYLGSQISISSSNNSICEGDSVVLIASGGESYMWAKTHWDAEQGIYINEDTIGFGESVTLTESGSYRVRGTDSTGCYQWSNSSTVTVYPNPTFELFGQTEICEGDSTVIIVSADGDYNENILPLETFSDGIPDYWSVFNNNLVTYTIENSGHETALKFPCYELYSGTVDELLIPDLDFRESQTPILRFDVAYRSYDTESDQLRVLCSTDQGDSWIELYSKAGQALSTLESSHTSFIPTDDQWRTDSIDMSAMSGAASVMIKFEFTSNYGNNLWIDNIGINVSSGHPHTYVWSTGETGSQQTFNTMGTWHVTVSDSHCSATDSVTITVWQPDTVDITVNSPNNYYIMNGEAFCHSGDYMQTLQNIHGCDSMINLHLTLSLDTTVVYDTVYGYYNHYEQYGLRANIYGRKFTYMYQMEPDKFEQWADSVLAASDIPVALTYDSTTNMASGKYILVYSSRKLPGSSYKSRYLYPDYNIWKDSTCYYVSDTLTGVSSLGCDSTVIWHTIIFFEDIRYAYLEACGSCVWQGDSIYINGTTATGNSVLWFVTGDTLTEPGIYTQYKSYTNINGCDSTYRLYLTIYPATYEDMSDTACDNYSLNGITYTESGVYTHYSDTTIAITRDLFWRNYNWGYWDNFGFFRTFTPSGWSSVYWSYNYDDNWNVVGIVYYYYDGSGTVHDLDSINQVVQYVDTVDACKETTLHLTINHSVTESFEATACDFYTWNDSTYTTSGEYIQTFTAANGCDSIVTLQLTVNPSVAEVVEVTSCDSYTWNETTYTSSGEYTQTFTAANGCDSTVTLQLTILPLPTPNITGVTTVCEGQTATLTATGGLNYQWEDGTTTNTFPATESGIYTVTVTDAEGCSATASTTVTVNPLPEVVITGSTSICPGGSTILTATGADSYQWSNGSTNPSISVNMFGQYSVIGTSAAGCFSTASVTVLVSQPPTITVSGNTDICAGESTTLTVSGGISYMWSDGSTDSVRTVNVGGTWQVIGYNEIGCSGMTSVTVNVWQPAATSLYITSFDSCYVWFGTPRCESGDYTYTLQTIHGCDSVITLHLTLEDAITNEFSATGCGSYTWNNITYQQSGDYTQTFTATNGNDSIVTLHLTILQPVFSEISDTVCEVYVWNGTTYAFSGDYTQTFTAANGCDSTITLHLTVHYGTHNVETETACESYEWHGQTYTTSGTYTHAYENATGCPSVDTLHLTIHYGTHNMETETACENFVWHGETYTESGIYTYAYENANGCASVDTLQLTINPTEETEFTITTEDSCYIWNGVPYCTSGTYTQTLSSAHGCDSTVTLHLTITVGIDNHDGFDFKVYPNPTTGVVNVECTMNNMQAETMEFHVYDAYGKLVDVVETLHATSLQTDAHGASVNSAQIDLSRFAPGVYLLKAVADGNVVAVRKVVKN